MRKLSTLFLLLFTVVANAQVVHMVRLRPGPADSINASIWKETNSANKGDQNILANAWTAGSDVTFRSLFKFNLPVLPTNATFVSATLKLYGNATSNHAQLNSSYQGAPFGTTNESWLQRISAPWNLYTLNWTNQPSVDTAGQVLFPASTAQLQTYVVDVSRMVKAMLDTPSKNYGFMFRLKNEVKYRTLLFGSSHNPDSNVRPILEIVYNTPVPGDSQTDPISRPRDETASGFPGPDPASTNVAAQNAVAGQVSIYPNPASQKLHIGFANTKSESVTLSLIDAMGRTVIYRVLQIDTRGLVDLNVSEIPHGLYFLKINRLNRETLCKTISIQ
jgi:hypothetical protein